MKNNHLTKEQLLNELAELSKQIIEMEKSKHPTDHCPENSNKTLLLDSATDSIFLLDFKGNFLYINKTAYTSLDNEQSDFIGMDLYDLDVTEQIKLIKSQLKDSTDNRKNIYESNHIHKDKSMMAVEIHAPIIKLHEKIILSIARDIKERKQIEINLKREHQKLMDIIEFLPDATFVIDQDKKVIAWNKTIEDMTGVPKEEILGDSNYAYSVPFYGVRRPILIDLVYSQDGEVEALYDYVKRKGDTLYAEAFMPSLADGKGAFLWAKASPLYDENGNFAGAIETVRDITERKKVKRSLEEQLHFLQDLMDSIPSPIFYKDNEGIYLKCNSAFEKYIGLPKEKIINKTVYDVAPTELANKYYQMDLELIKNPGQQVYEAPVRYADSTKHEVLFNKATYIDNHGNLAGIIGIMMDITERKQAEEALKKLKDHLEIKIKDRTAELSNARDKLEIELNAHKKTENALKESEERYRGIVEGMQSGVISIDSEANILYVNQHMADMFGYTEQETIGRSMYGFVDAEGQVKLRKHLKRRKAGISEIYELKLIRKDGSPLWALISANPLFNAKSQYMGSVGIITDISARKGVEKALKEAVIEKDNYTRLIISNMIEAVNLLMEREHSEFRKQQSNLT